LHADGCRAAEQFVVTPANPSGEVTLRFIGKLLAAPDAEPVRLLRESVDAVYQPQTTDALERLTSLVLTTETAYFDNANRDSLGEVGLFFIDEGFLSTSPVKGPGYLTDMTAYGRRSYRAEIAPLIGILEEVRPHCTRQDAVDLTILCLQNVLKDVDAVIKKEHS
jgi:hypothetical protein